MAKTFSKCKLCGGMKFVNYAGMCKRCNTKKEGHNIMKKALEKRIERIDSRKKEVKIEQEEAKKEESEKSTEETKEAKSEEKKEKPKV